VTARPPIAATIPELGPLLGRLIAPPGDYPPPRAGLEEVRLEFLSILFERAGAARGLLAAGDPSQARVALGSRTWIEVWERAVAGAEAVLAEEANRLLKAAAAVSRFPPKRLATLLPGPDNRRLQAARLSAAGIPLEEAAARLDRTTDAWEESVRLVAGELEAAWDSLLAISSQELAKWERRAAEVREWRRPWLPLVLIGVVLLGIGTWVGLMLGGYLPVPGWFLPVANWFWGLS